MQNTKINTILLVVAIVLIALGIWMMQKNKAVAPEVSDTSVSPSSYTQTKSNAGSPDYQPAKAPTAAVTLDMNNPDVQKYATLFTNEFALPANYIGHFRLVSPGCGSNCFTLYALDKNTGQTYKLGNDFYQDYQARDNAITLTTQGGVVSVYRFNETTKQFDVASR